MKDSKFVIIALALISIFILAIRFFVCYTLASVLVSLTGNIWVGGILTVVFYLVLSKEIGYWINRFLFGKKMAENIYEKLREKDGNKSK